MKRLAVLLGILAFSVYSFAQTEAVADATVPDSLSQTPYAMAEEAFERFFALKAEPSVNKDLLYKTLMDCFQNYVKGMDDVDETQKADMKEKLRRLRPEFEIAGIDYSSGGDNRKAYKYLECYLNIPDLPMFAGERFPKSEQYPAYVFIVAAESHNSRDYESAVDYLHQYIELGEKQNQQTCYEFLASDLELLKRYDEEMTVLDEGIMNYPNSIKMLKRAISLYTQFGEKEKSKEMFRKAIALAPDDTDLQRFKADIDYQNDRFADALPVFAAYYEQNPSDLNRAKKLALCHYNLAGALLNESQKEADAEKIKTLRNEATEHFNKSITLLETLSKNPEMVRADPLVIRALTEALTQVGRRSEADQIRQQAAGDMALSVNPANAKKAIPNFNEWYKPRMERALAEWERRGEFEPAEEYVRRVNPETRKEMIAQSRLILEQDFIREYSEMYNLEDLTIKPYDPDHQTYCIRTKQGDIYLRVPLASNEAKKFKDNWSGVKIQSPQFRVDKGGKLLLATAVFATPDGQYYQYDANADLEYGKVAIAKPEWGDDPFAALAVADDKPAPTPKEEEAEAINVGESTVDVNVPKTKEQNKNTFALIIANEDYKKVEGVPFATNDGRSFKRYCQDVFGVPEDNIVSAFNATYSDMIEAIDRIKEYERAYEDMKLLVFYSGHGQPDPSSKEAYLLPVDASPRNMSTSYKLSKFYQELTAYNPGSVTVFLDACFSGAKKDGQVMDTEARGVIIVPRDEAPVSNMVIFSACSGDETAYPYKNQKHGLFTYFLLKKLQEDKGKTTYKQLAEYISKNVKQQSIRLQGKIQTPTTRSALPPTEWGGWRLDK